MRRLASLSLTSAALIALEAADKRLAQSDRPGLLGLRRVIARDMDRLRAAPVLDVPGLAPAEQLRLPLRPGDAR